MSTSQHPDLAPDAVPGTPGVPPGVPAPPYPPRLTGGRTRQARDGRPLIAATGAALAVAAGFAARGLWAAGPQPAVTAAVPVATATVVRTDLSARQPVAGTLGYLGLFTIASEADGGLLTWLPAPGDVVRRGQPLFAVNGQPATLLYGQVPAWRAFAPGMSPGPDVRQLQRNLAALGFGPGSADGQFGWSTEAAVERWQRARGLVASGTIPLGAVAFMPGPLRVTTVAQPLGGPVAAGTNVLTGTSLTPGVQVSLTLGGPAVHPGDRVLVTLPDGTTTVPGTVRSVGSVATPPPGGPGTGGQGAASAAADVIPVTIVIGAAVPAGLDQAPVQVAITEQRANNVLAVPVTALLAEPDGGYAVQVTGPHGQLIPVATGIFDDASGLVAVTGPGLAPGLSVTVAQG